MANHCLNSLTITGGNKSAVERICAEFARLFKSQKADQGQYIFGDEAQTHCIFDLGEPDQTNAGEPSFSYTTKWSPNAQDLIDLASREKFDFVLKSEELGNLVFCETAFKDGRASYRELDSADFEMVKDLGDDTYRLEGVAEPFECDTDAYDHLLSKKWFAPTGNDLEESTAKTLCGEIADQDFCVTCGRQTRDIPRFDYTVQDNIQNGFCYPRGCYYCQSCEDQIYSDAHAEGDKYCPEHGFVESFFNKTDENGKYLGCYDGCEAAIRYDRSVNQSAEA